MAAEWIDPRYADIVAAMRRAQAADTPRPDTVQDRIRGFIVPTK